VTSLALISILVMGTAWLGAAQASPPAPQAASPQQSASGWEVVPGYPFDQMSVAHLSPTNVWTGSYEQFLHWTGGEYWFTIPAGDNSFVTGMHFFDAGSAWASTSQGELLLLDASGWNIHSRPTTAWLDDISMASGSDGWAVGEQGTILRYSGGTWKSFSSPTTRWLTAVDMVNASNGWAVGALVILQWDGSGWRQFSGPELIFRGIDMLADGTGWAVGSGGVMYYFDGGTWSEAPRVANRNLNGIDILENGEEGWAVGDDGILVFFDGEDWHLKDSPTTEDLIDVSLYASDDGWAVGRGGVLLHYTGPPADLSPSTKAVSPIYAQSGEVLTYDIHVRNSGGAEASVVVTDATPVGTTFNPGSESTTQGTIVGTDPLVVDVGLVGPSDEVTISFAVTVQEDPSGCWFVENEALINGGEILTRTATSTIGNSCFSIYLPVAFRNY
jgi:uncharacterized repeat protein (TIGR01451 family)